MTAEQTSYKEAAATSRVVIIGAGFGGLEVAKGLGRAGIGATLIDRHNHHLFQPLLYQVATAALSAPDVAEPIRKILRRYTSVQMLLGNVVRIETGPRLVHMSYGGTLPYDYLILAPGAEVSYFGNEHWRSHAPGLKTIEDARTIRSRLLLTFEKAERTTDAVEQDRLLTIAIIGGGPTGVELAGSIAELSRHTLIRDFRSIRPERTRIMLIEAGPRLLAGFAPEMSDFAHHRLERLGVTVMTGTSVTEVTQSSLMIHEEEVPVGLVVWAAGVVGSPLGKQLGVPVDRAGRVKVTSALQVEGCNGVFALGDLALCVDELGKPLPGLAQVAKQQGIHLGRALSANLRYGTPFPPFVYRSRGNTAIVGRHAAVFETGKLRIKGWTAWAAWAVIHVYLLVGFQHRLIVSLQWLWRYLTYERGARLIAEDPAHIDAGGRGGLG